MTSTFTFNEKALSYEIITKKSNFIYWGETVRELEMLRDNKTTVNLNIETV